MFQFNLSVTNLLGNYNEMRKYNEGDESTFEIIEQLITWIIEEFEPCLFHFLIQH